MTSTARTLLDQLIEETKKDIAPEMKEHDFFEYFCAKSLFADQSFDIEEIKYGLIGIEEKRKTGSDGGLDAIYVLINQRLVRTAEEVEALKGAYKQAVEITVILAQSTTEEGFSLNRLLRFKDTFDDIFCLNRNEFSEQYNVHLAEAIRTFRALHKAFLTKHVTVHVQYFYMTRGDSDKIAKDVIGLKREIEENAKNILATIQKCEVIFLGAREVYELANRKPTETYPLPCSVSMQPKSGGACSALVKLSDYAKFITDEKRQIRTSLFEANVRDYQGDVAVNEAIGNTLASGKGEFWWLNNGITIITTRLGGHPRELVMDNPQIVNGLQTSQKIFDHFQKRKDLLDSDERELLIRVIQVGAEDSETMDAIIEATNSQTKVPPATLWATKRIHRDIESILGQESLYYDRRKNSYRRKAIPLNKVVGISELAQYIAATILREPDNARARPAKYFQDTAQHDRIFSEKFNPSIWGVIARLGKRVDTFLREDGKYREHRHNLLFYTLMATVCLALKAAKPKSERIATLESKKLINDDLLRKAATLAKKVYEQNGSDDRAAKGTEMLASLKLELRGLFHKKRK